MKLTTDKTLCKPKSVTETLQILCLPITSRTANTRRMFQSGAQTINRCGSLSLSAGTPHILTNTQTHTQRLTVPLWLPPHTQYTHHNDLARPTPCWSVYLLHSNLPLGFDNSSFMPLWRCRGTTPCLSVHLSVHLSVLPVTQWHEWQIRSWSAARDPETESKVFRGHSDSRHVCVLRFLYEFDWLEPLRGAGTGDSAQLA